MKKNKYYICGMRVLRFCKIFILNFMQSFRKDDMQISLEVLFYLGLFFFELRVIKWMEMGGG